MILQTTKKVDTSDKNIIKCGLVLLNPTVRITNVNNRKMLTKIKLLAHLNLNTDCFGHKYEANKV